MALGTMVSKWVSGLISMSFPTYVGAMFVAVIMRNLNEKFRMYNFNYPLVEGIGDVMLSLYLSLALMTLKLWELSGLIGGVAIRCIRSGNLYDSCFILRCIPYPRQEL